MIPSVEICLELMKKYCMLGNIKTHSLMVARIAHLIAKGLNDAGVDISVSKATAGALMHDIGKTVSLKNGEDHSEIGRKICLDNQLEEIADIVGEHVRLKGYHIDGNYSEKEIVYYSDKRVNHDEIVSLNSRLAYILDQYGKDEEDLCRRIRENFSLCEKVEKKLFKKLDFGPEALFFLAKDEQIF